MKKGFLIILAWLLLLVACGNPAQNPGTSVEQTELVVFAAASMSGVLVEVAELYQAANTNVRIVFNFDSSGTLRTQIQEGAYADLFISAAQREMDQLDEQGFVQSRVDFLENQVVLVVPLGNPRGIESFNDMVQALTSEDVLMAIGNMDVPVGRYAQEILSYFGLNDAELAAQGVISFGSNVREVALQVSEASVDMGIVYLTDAVDNDLVVVDTATSNMSGRVIYPAAVLNISQTTYEAQAFLDFLVGDEAIAVFSAWGFTTLV